MLVPSPLTVFNDRQFAKVDVPMLVLVKVFGKFKTVKPQPSNVLVPILVKLGGNEIVVRLGQFLKTLFPKEVKNVFVPSPLTVTNDRQF